MNTYPESIVSLIQSLTTLPGIGRKTAERLALHILHAPRNEALTLARHIVELRERVRLCRECFALSDQDVCSLCTDPGRDRGSLCVVESPSDMAAIEKSGALRGLYHILGGALSPMDGIGPDEIRLAELFKRCASNSIQEVILATGTDVEGEATASYIADHLKTGHVTVTRIASGIPMGGDLHYADQVTLQRAMEGRRGI